MYSRQGTYTTQDLEDFSSALAQANTAGGLPTMDNTNLDPANGKSAQSFSEFDPYNNRNLSSILSRIRDEGPASPRPGSSENPLDNSAVKNSAHAATTQKSGDTSVGVAHSTGSEQGIPPEAAISTNNDHGNNTGQRRSSAGQQLVLILLVAVIAVMGSMLNHLQTQTDEMMAALRLNEQQSFSAANAQQLSSDILPRVSSLSETISGLREELQTIKADYKAFDSKLASAIPEDLKPQLMEIVAASKKVNTLQHEIGRIQHKVLEMGTEINDIKGEIIPELTPQPADSWIVNLASLSSRDRALTAFNKLQQSGVVPLLQEVIVNGSKMYRLSVGGFTSHEAASSFIKEARKKYGFEGGWIRHIQT